MAEPADQILTIGPPSPATAARWPGLVDGQAGAPAGRPGAYLLSPGEIPDLLAIAANAFSGIAALAHFRRRLLELPGWEQFTALFLFFVSEDDRLDGDDDRARFAAKVPHEVRVTTGALGRLEARLAEICGWSSSRRP
jgi:hypothetical protein